MDNRISFAQPLGSRAGGLSYTVLIAVNLLISLIVQTILMGSGAYGTDGAKYVSFLVAPLAIGVTMLFALLLFKQPPGPVTWNSGVNGSYSELTVQPATMKAQD